MTRDKDAVKAELLSTFRQAQARPGTMLPPKWLQRHYLPSLAADEQGAFDTAVEELVAEGLVERVQRGSANLRLTARGAERLAG